MNNEETIIKLFNIANDLMVSSEYKLAFEIYSVADKYNTKYFEIPLNAGNCLFALGKYRESLHYYIKSCRFSPNKYSIYSIGRALAKLMKYKFAEEFLYKSLSHDPTYENCYLELFNIYSKQNNKNLMLKCAKLHNDALPDTVSSNVNLGLAYFKHNFFQESIDSYRRALEIDPSSIIANYNIAFPLLCLNNYTDGFIHFEYRKYITEKYGRSFNPTLNPTHINTSSQILRVILEGGYGDFIMMSRYFDILIESYQSVEIEVKPVMLQLAQSVFDNCKFVEQSSIETDRFCIDLMSLPYLFCTKVETIPILPIGYNKNCNLFSPINNRRMRVSIGICWKSSNIDSLMNDRDVLDSEIEALFVLNADFVILDYNNHAIYQDISKRHSNVHFYSNYFSDFSDLRNIISTFDITITIDTALAHLSASVGLPTYVLLKEDYDWKWGHGCQSPWYPSVYKFPQRISGNWVDSINNLIACLGTLDLNPYDG